MQSEIDKVYEDEVDLKTGIALVKNVGIDKEHPTSVVTINETGGAILSDVEPTDPDMIAKIIERLLCNHDIEQKQSEELKSLLKLVVQINGLLHSEGIFEPTQANLLFAD